MNLIVCIDDAMGVQFNGRRQSRDRAVTEKIRAITGGQPLWMGPASAALFVPDEVLTGADFLDAAGPGAFCFAEGEPLAPYENKIETLYLFHWNRRYPADRKLDLDLDRWPVIRTEEFPGYSHEKITLEVRTHE